MVLFRTDGVLMVDSENRQVAEDTDGDPLIHQAPIKVLVRTATTPGQCSSFDGGADLLAGKSALSWCVAAVQRPASAGARYGHRNVDHRPRRKASPP